MTKNVKPTFEVDKAGLAKVLAKKGRGFALLELFQNSVDEDGVTEVQMQLNGPTSEGKYEMIVEDNSPEGFADLTHAYTLFAESAKKKHAEKRGRFNLGEKLVIAVCDYVQIATTKGTIEFTDEGRTEHPATRDTGSKFTGLIGMTPKEARDTEGAVDTLLIPGHVRAWFNGRELEKRVPTRTFEATLRTELADSEGYMRPTTRKTKVSVYEPREGERAMLYEMGIPVVEIGGRWHVDIGQKVPLNTDRDNVPPGWLRDVRVEVLNHGADLLAPEETKEKWVSDAIEDEKVEGNALQAVVKGRYGEKTVIEDRTDPEGTKIAMQRGYTVIPGGAFSKTAWKHVKQHETVKPAGQVTPSPNPNIGDDTLKLMDPEHYPMPVRQILQMTSDLVREALGIELEHRVVADVTWPFAATYGRQGPKRGKFTWNYGSLGHAFFTKGMSQRVLRLVIHELAHHTASDHLSKDYYEATCAVGATIALALADMPRLLEIPEMAGTVA